MPDTKPALSIITAVYQGRQYIASCIESVINQNYDSVEHIIVDGASTDGTVEIVKSYLQKYPHIRFISEKDRGQSDALNKGIKLAQSKIIGILNADDFYEPDVFRQVAEHFLKLKEPVFLAGNCNVLGENDQIKYVNKAKRLRKIDLLLGWEINQTPISPAYFYHKSLHEKVGYYEESEHLNMDVKFLLKVVEITRAHYIDKTWGNFRFIPGTKTYKDVKTGSSKRLTLYLDSIINQLPLLSRCWVKFLKYRKVAYFYYRIHYYLESPVERIRKTLLKYI